MTATSLHFVKLSPSHTTAVPAIQFDHSYVVFSGIISPNSKATQAPRIGWERHAVPQRNLFGFLVPWQIMFDSIIHDGKI